MFDSFCKKTELNYYIMFGTLLGAVRHKGFITWDNDIDVVIPRKGYEKLLKMNDYYSDSFFLQILNADHGYCQSHAKIRNSMTAAFNRITDYEVFKLPAPSGYDEILKITYGDYMEFSPVDKRGGHNLLAYSNDSFVYDMDKPYTEYLRTEALQ